MPTYVVLLRGINVAGKNRLGMSDLRSLLSVTGGSDVRTYLQSGNAVLSHPSTDAGQLAVDLERRLAGIGVPARVLLRGTNELAAVLAANPYLAGEPDRSKLHVTFLAELPAADRVERLQVPAGETAAFTVRGREVLLHCPDGYGRTKLNNAFLENRLATVATTRNLKTVVALHELAGPDAR